MGLRYTLTKEQNRMCMDIAAYWHITNLSYTTDLVNFCLVAYPTRDCAERESLPVESRLSFGSPYSPIECELYRWQTSVNIREIFPSGIPLDANEQKTAIYNWVKAYTGLPWEDVYEN